MSATIRITDLASSFATLETPLTQTLLIVALVIEEDVELYEIVADEVDSMDASLIEKAYSAACEADTTHDGDVMAAVRAAMYAYVDRPTEPAPEPDQYDDEGYLNPEFHEPDTDYDMRDSKAVRDREFGGIDLPDSKY